jgi:hypothetical protein
MSAAIAQAIHPAARPRHRDTQKNRPDPPTAANDRW